MNLSKHLPFAKENRRFRRMALDLPAAVTLNGIDDFSARLVNISPGDLALCADAKTVVGDAVVVSISGVDILEGTVARVFPGGFAVSFRLSRRRRAQLVERLMLCMNPKLAEGLNDRRHSPRHSVNDQRLSCRLEDGTSLFVRAIDRSADGAAVEASRRPQVGASIHIGRRRGVVLRHTPRGFVVIFDRPKTDDAQKPEESRLRAV